MRKMGKLSKVPIEPKEQTALLDVCVSQAGVIGGGVPGGESWMVYRISAGLTGPISAGGYDAIWLLICDPPEHRLGEKNYSNA